MGMIRDGIAAMRDIQFDALDEEVLYRRADGIETDILAVPGRTVFQTHNEYGQWVRLETRDFLVRAADMEADPVAGEEIVFDERTYEILAPNGEPCWRWSDPFHTVRRVHTKLTGGES